MSRLLILSHWGSEFRHMNWGWSTHIHSIADENKIKTGNSFYQIFQGMPDCLLEFNCVLENASAILLLYPLIINFSLL